MKDARLNALVILLKMDKNEVFISDLLQDIEDDFIDERDKNLTSEIVYGVTKNLLYIDYIIMQASSIKLKKIHKAILNILRLSVYQLFFLDKVPASAVVNEGVKLAKSFGNRGSVGYVNGVLRNINRNKEKYMEVEEKNILKYLSTKYSHPEFYVEQLITHYGCEFTESLLSFNNRQWPFTIRVNTLKTDRNKLLEMLEDKGYEGRAGSLCKDAIIVKNPTNIFKTELFKKGYFYVQDQSSIIAAEILNPRKGSVILDICAAPGGKTTHLAQIMGNEGKVVARDKSNEKINKINENAKRLGITIIATEVKDASIYYEEDLDRFDYILLDAPCSGFGLLRKKPEIKWNKKQTDIEELSKIQQNMLKIASKYLKIGGELLYSTCTLTVEENEYVIEKFLQKHSNFELIPIRNKKTYKVFTNECEGDGFSMSMIKRKF